MGLPAKGYTTSQNYSVEYHGKSDIDGHFGHLQSLFNEHERKQETRSTHCVLLCFLDHFLTVPTDANFEIYEDPGNGGLVEKLQVKNEK